MMTESQANGSLAEQQATLSFPELSNLAISVWRARRRAERFSDTPQPVLLAIQGAIEHFEAIGVTLRDLIGDAYDDNMRVHVVDTIDAGGARIISDCIAPAVYYRGMLVRSAEVVVTGKIEGDSCG